MTETTEIVSPSPIIDYFVRSMAKVLPEADRGKLDAFNSQVATTTDVNDKKRAWRCAEWALDIANDSGQSELARIADELREIYHLWKDSIFGIGFGVNVDVGDGEGPLNDVLIQWVDASVDIAEKTAAKIGWEKVEWEMILQELIAMEND